ncbi:MAG: preprotein translocase subunit YajC [Oscillospiraceae bacterium]|jgi:preprotein translocase subunit YajC|nr:preprotein translocase subunit YajC [Oscillospiraceae bacterium]
MNFISYLNYALLLAPAPADGSAGGSLGAFDMLGAFFPLIALVGVFYLLLIRPERKRSKKTKEMRETLQIADEIVTSGGIIGRVLSIKDDTVLIETGGDRTRIRILRSAIAENRTIHDN